jgi:MFS family permease
MGPRSRLSAAPPPFVLKYYLYRATVGVSFTMPIWYLYLEVTTGSYALAAAANSVWWTSVVLLEIPTGYVGDRIGRRRALLVGNVLRAGSMAAMAFVGSFAEVVVVFVVWSFATTFRSGTADAWLYEVLGDRLDEDDFAHVRGRGGTVAAVVSGATALAGGYIAETSMATVYLVGGAVVALGIPVILSLPDAPPQDEQFTVLDAVPVLRERFSRPPLRSFVLLVGLYTGVHWGVNFFVQPVSVELGLSKAHLGWMFAAFTAVTGAVSYFSGPLKERVGVRRWFRAVPLLLGGVFLAVAVEPLLAIPAFFLMRGLRGASLPLANQFLNDHVDDVGRATLLSTAGMVYKLVTVPFELGAGTLGDVIGPVETIGLFGGVLVVGSVVVVLVGRPFGSAAAGAERPVPAD